MTRLYAYTALLIFSLLASSPMSAEESHKEAETFDLSEVLVHHLMDAPIFEWNLCLANTKLGSYDLCGRKVYAGSEEFENDAFRRYVFSDEKGQYKWQGGIPLHITKRVSMMFVSSFLLLVIMILAARLISRNPFQIRSRFTGIVEAVVQYVRVEVADKNMHHEKGWHAYILTLFFFILFSNLLGLFPPFGEIAETIAGSVSGHGASHGHSADSKVSSMLAFWPGITVTGDIAVTLALASMVTIMIWVTGFKSQGVSFLWSCIPSGMPLPVAIGLWPLLFPLEIIIGPLAKGFALAIRLLANMTAGHVIIIALLGFIFQFKNFWYFIAPISVAGAGAIYLLEVMVAFLQAFIFSLLASLFIGSSMHRH